MTNDYSAGTRVRALDFPRSQQVFDLTSMLNLTNTAYSSFSGPVGTPEVGVRFQAPTSGRVAVVLSAGIRNNTTANEDRLWITFQVYVGDPDDGVEFQSEEVKLGLSNPSAGSDNYQYGGHLTMVQGLTPGLYYHCRVHHRTTLGSGTADISYRKILVFPIP